MRVRLWLITVRSCIRSISKSTIKEVAHADTLESKPGIRAGKDLILATRSYAADHTMKSWWHILSTVTLLILALAATFLDFYPLVRIGFSIFAGLLLLRLFVIYHDQQHHAILPKSRVMEFFMYGFGIYALSPSSIWRSSHNHHHKHNSKIKGAHIGSFPIMTKTHYLESSDAVKLAYRWSRHPLTILFGYLSIFLYGMCLKPFLTKPREHFDCLIALVLHIGIGVALIHYLGWHAWLLVQVIPHFTTYAIGSYLFYAQHNFPDVSFYDKAGWTYEKAALESSSYMKMSPVMAYFTGNIGYHHIHHLNARIPFYRLPEVQREMPEVRNPKVTYLNPFEIRRCLQLKVWDVAAQRMVGLP